MEPPLHDRPLRAYKDYAIGVICALAIEKAAVEAILDERHPPLETIQGDENSYTLGRIGKHNVVVACFPLGVIGNNSAATVAKDMLRSFPIKIGLMVGVGGGVWSQKVNMRLGDVVVSQPDGTHGGVVQWDFGKMEKGGLFKRKGSLNKPPRVLLNALQDIKIRHITEGDKLVEHLSTMVTNSPRMAQTFGYQGAEHDKLFEATYDHEHGDTCDDCDQDRVIERLPARTDHAPRIHYGNIASGNEVMKHAMTRDRIASEEGVICFEMEAAGLMDSFPCLVIRGICDYADSHKNKRWQPYAAATAAAFAKELLSVINKQEVDELGPVKPARYRTGFSLEGVPSTDKFVDRPLDMETLEHALLPRSQNTRQKTVVLHGLGGMGKTQLAVEFARRHHQQFTSVFWLDGRSEDRLKQSVANAASRVPEGQIAEMSRLYSKSGSGDSDVVVRDMMNWLNEPNNTDWLLIFDNIDREYQQDNADPDAYDVRRYLPGADHGSILITTRLARLGQLGVPWSLSKAGESQARAIFQEWYGTDVDPIKIAELLQLLDGLPLALAQAGTYIRETGIDFAKYIDFYKQQWRDLMELQDRRGAPLYDYGNRSIWTTWTISFKAIQKTNEAAAHLLLLWAFLDNRDLWYGLLAAARKRSAFVAKHLSKWLRDIPENELKFTDAIQLLRNYSMVESMQGLSSHSTHPVVHKWALHVQDQKQRMELARMAVLLVGLAVPHNSTKEYWTTQRRLLPHAQSCSQWILDSGVDLSSMGWGSNHAAGRDKEGRRVVSDAIAWLGILYKNQGKLGEAEKMYQRALPGLEKTLGPEHTSTLDTVCYLGNLYSEQGRLDEAEKMYQRALQGFEKVIGPDHTSTLSTVNNLGLLYSNQGKLGEAEKMYERALPGFEKAIGPDHTSTLSTVNNLGLLYSEQDKLDEAEKMYQRALQGYEKALGPDHTLTLDTVNNLGILYGKLKKLDQAEDMYQRAMQGFEKALGPEHMATLDTVNNLGNLYSNQGKLDEAEKVLLRALQGKEKTLRPDHMSTLDTVNNLGIIYAKLGKPDQAENMYQRALQGYEKKLGREPVKTYIPAINTAYNLGLLYAGQNKSDKARAMYLRALVGYQSVFGQDHAYYRQVDELLEALENPESKNPVVLGNDTNPARAPETSKITPLYKTVSPPSRRQRFLRKLGFE